MGYTLMIGELDVDYDPEDGYVAHICEPKRLDNAPAFGEPTDYTNERWPTFESWEEFAVFTGLYDFFYDHDNGLIKEEGCATIGPSHVAIIENAIAMMSEKLPEALPIYAPELMENPDLQIKNMYRIRLVWLKFWFDWAIANCRHPVIYNG